MKPSLQFRLSQHLTLTPQLQQSIRLLQLSRVSLTQEIARLLRENPALEREDADEAEPHAAVAAGPSSSTSAPTEEAPAAPEADWSVETAATWRGASDEDEERSFATPDTPTLRDHLRSQLSLTNLSARDRGFVALLIDALDEDGYLTQSLEEIAALLPAEAERNVAYGRARRLDPEAMPPPPGTPLVCGNRRRRAQWREPLLPAAGSPLADQERAAALRDHPARVAGDRRSAAPFPRTWR